jgi:hypothetical protein
VKILLASIKPAVTKEELDGVSRGIDSTFRLLSDNLDQTENAFDLDAAIARAEEGSNEAGMAGVRHLELFMWLTELREFKRRWQEQSLSTPFTRLLGRLPGRFQWTLHNLVAHPLSEVLYQIGLEKASNYIHDHTTPVHDAGNGRG